MQSLKLNQNKSSSIFSSPSEELKPGESPAFLGLILKELKLDTESKSLKYNFDFEREVPLE